MKPEAAKQYFINFIEKRNLQISDLTPNEGIKAMIEFYLNERADYCPPEDDGDMLLYQWGTYDWGKGENFELNITRQLITDNGPEAENIWQLSLTFKYEPSSNLSEMGNDNKWCESLKYVKTLKEFINNTVAYKILNNTPPKEVTLDYECAG